jgi:ABC-2 type transport system ATP-binding protein
MIEAKQLTKRYRKQTVVDDLSFAIETGKVTGFLGPNGAGKSTTMRLMLGLDNGTGTTIYDGKHLHEYEQPSKVVGILLEAKAFHPTRTARNHLRVLAAAGNIPLSRVDEVLDIVGLSTVANKKPGKFSLGMSQRLGIAAAILGKPKYLILDEPANGLDPEGIAWLREFLKGYADQGNAVMVSSHLLSEMAQMADNILVIGKGKLIANTSIEALLAGKSGEHVVVRAADLALLTKVLDKNKYPYTLRDGALVVTGQSKEIIGELAFRAGIALHELSSEHASLEDAFLDLTGEAEEYKTRQEKTV